MRPLDKLAIEEVQNLAAEGDLDPETRLANAAELRALRALHMIAARETRGSLKFIQIISSLPGVGDVAAWKRLVASSRAALEAPELVLPGDKK